MNKSKNDLAWGQIFEKYCILDKVKKHGYVLINSSDINQFREARLMTKFDHRSQLPELFVEYNLSILPISRGMYQIGEFKTFCDFNKDDVKTTFINFSNVLESVDYENITSEANAINCAFVSKILHNFTGENNLLPTVFGRMSSSVFDFQIVQSNPVQNNLKISVNNSQIEIDGGYEGDNSLSLIEAKNYISDDFMIRQLYYPYRLWSKKIKKHVRPIFLTYSNGIFYLREYKFVVPEFYNSIKLINYKKYAIQELCICADDIKNILDSVNIVEEPNLPFPQANSFERVINLCELLKHKEFICKDDITQNYGFDRRQTDYYLNAAKYLGLIDIVRDESQQIGCTLTETGSRIFELHIVERQLEFVRRILEHTVFKNTLKLYFDNERIPLKEEIVEIMKNAKLYNIDSAQTYKRRASTVISWINWILRLIEQ